MPYTVPDAVRSRREELEHCLDRDRAVLTDLQTRVRERRQAIQDAEAELRGIDFTIKAFLPDSEDALAAASPETPTVPKRRRRTKAQMEEARRAAPTTAESEIPPAVPDMAEEHSNPAKPEMTARMVRAFLARSGDLGDDQIGLANARRGLSKMLANGDAETFEDAQGDRRYRLRQPQPETRARGHNDEPIE